MVLRVLLSVIVFTFTGSLFAQTRITTEDKRIFAQAKQAYSGGRYDLVLNLLNRRFNLRDPKTPSGALALAAYTYEKLDQWKNAETLYAYLITRRYKGDNKKVIGAYRASGIDDLPDIPKKLLQFYHRRAEALTQIYINDHRRLRPRIKELYKKTALMYVAIIDESDYEDDSYDTIPDRIEKFDSELEARRFETAWYIKSAYMSWRDQISIILPNGQRSEIDTTGEGLCLGGGWRYENEYWEFNVNGCYASAAMTVGKENSSINYFQNGVASNALFFGPSALWKPSSKGAAFGFHIPFVYRTGDYTEPQGATLEETSIFTFGYLLEAQWRYEKWGAFTQFGKIRRFSSALWAFGIHRSF